MGGWGGKKIFGVEKRCEVIDQKRVRVLDRGIQKRRNGSIKA